MRWVKLTLPPRPRASALLITIRLSTRSLAGTVRTDVAVGTVRLSSMFVTTRAAAPRSVRSVPAVGFRGWAFLVGAAGSGATAVVPVGVCSPCSPGR